MLVTSDYFPYQECDGWDIEDYVLVTCMTLGVKICFEVVNIVQDYDWCMISYTSGKHLA